MPRLTVDGREVEVPAGATILDAARRLGIHIPTLCQRDGLPHRPSCMVCLVKLEGRPRSVPSCAYPAEEGLRVVTDDPELRHARRAALELLLSEHAGDCAAPCVHACPAHMDIPGMMAHLAAGDAHGALVLIKQTIALPATLGYVCPAPCEGACRRAPLDSAASICVLKRHAAEEDLRNKTIYRPQVASPSGRRVAIVGAGPAGLAALWHLAQSGHACEIFDDHAAAGGMLRYGVDRARLPQDTLDAEVEQILSLASQFHPGCRLGENLSLDGLRRDFDAVLLACGPLDDATRTRAGLPVLANPKAGPEVAEMPGVFAAGGVRSPSRLAVRAVAAGRAAAEAIDRYFAASPKVSEDRSYTHRLGRLNQDDVRPLAAQTPAPRLPAGRLDPVTVADARAEASRCLQCGCGKTEACGLRKLAGELQVTDVPKGERRALERDLSHPLIVYEAGKCIACGRCVRLAEQSDEPVGLAWRGRGFGVRVAPAFGSAILSGLTHTALAAADACPTGALVRRTAADTRKDA